MSRDPVRRTAVVLAGGTSRRFGSDKLAADLGGRSLLDRVLTGLPAEMDVVVVGPERAVCRSATFTREDPRGGGPAAAVVAGVSVALRAGAEEILVVPGDTPGAGRAVATLLARLSTHPVVVAQDPDGRDQPLLLGLTRAGAALLTAGGPARGLSARALLERLQPPAVRVEVPAADLADIDTPSDLAGHRWRRP